MVDIAVNDRIKSCVLYQGVLSIRQEGHDRYPQTSCDRALAPPRPLEKRVRTNNAVIPQHEAAE